MSEHLRFTRDDADYGPKCEPRSHDGASIAFRSTAVMGKAIPLAPISRLLFTDHNVYSQLIFRSLLTSFKQIFDHNICLLSLRNISVVLSHDFSSPRRTAFAS